MTISKTDKLLASWHKLKNIYANNVKIRNSRYNVLKKNIEFKNCLKGKRCFIVGNGPSVKQQDLTLLENEIVFTVNKAVNHKDFEKIKTNYHFWTDPNLFVIESDEDKDIIEMMKSIRTENNNPVCFFPLKQKEFLKKYGLDSILDVRYIAPELGWMYEGFDEEFNLTKKIPQFGTVVQFCIAAALYMGADEIYFIGCDNTGIVNTINGILKENGAESHGYEISQKEIERIQRTSERNGLEIDTISYLNDIKAYRILNQYCKKRNVKLVNCSSRTVIDSVPREKFEDVIANKGA